MDAELWTEHEITLQKKMGEKIWSVCEVGKESTFYPPCMQIAL